MLQKLGEEIANALERAAEAEERAREATDPRFELDNERMAASWRLLARSFQYVESLEKFLIVSEHQRYLKPLTPPRRHPWE
jgi:hypothetical protein